MLPALAVSLFPFLFPLSFLILVLPMHQDPCCPVAINTPYIELDKLLKRENVAASGGEARFLISQGQALVNGTVETRKRRKLYPGDMVSCRGMEMRVVPSDSCSAMPGKTEQED